MLVNVSYNNKEITRKVDEAVGKPFTLKQRWGMGGIGSPRMPVTESSMEIRNLLELDNNLNTANIEIRPGGIIVRFRSLLETFALVIPWHKLTLYKGDADVWSVYRDHYFLKLRTREKAAVKFMKKLSNYKADQAPTTIEDL